MVKIPKPVIGVGKVDSLWFDASLSSDERAGSVARYQGHVRIDSRDAEWFDVSIVDISDNTDWKQTQFNSAVIRRDDLKLGRCDAATVPAWLARVASTLGVTWGAPYVRSGLRGTKRDRIAKWLFGR